MKSKVHRWSRKATALLVAGAILFAGVPAQYAWAASDKAALEDQSAELSKKLKDLDSKIAELEKEGSDAKAYIDAIDEKIELAQQRLEALRERVNLIDKEISSLDQSIAEIQEQIEAVEREVYSKQLRFDQSYEEFSYRMNAIYKSGVPTALELFLTASDFSQFLLGAELLSNVSKADKKSLQDLMEQMEEIRRDQEELQQKKSSLTEKKSKLLKTKEEQEAAKKEAGDAAASYERQEKEANEKLARLQKENSKYGELRVQTLRDKELLDQKILDAIKKPDPKPENGSSGSSGGSDAKPGTKPDSGGNSSGGSTQGQGMTWPAPKCNYITTYFNPQGINGRKHGGVDLAAAYESTGLPIVAADSGTVILTDVGGWGYSYGSYMMIRHANGLVTLYAHCSEVWVKEGQKVRRGEQIGRVGNTGNSRGAHLHFEVRNQSGTRVNPLNYIQWGR